MMDRLRVCLTTILCRLQYLPPWTSASITIDTLNMHSHREIVKFASFGFYTQADLSTNDLSHTLGYDVSVIPDIRRHWSWILCTCYLLWCVLFPYVIVASGFWLNQRFVCLFICLLMDLYIHIFLKSYIKPNLM